MSILLQLLTLSLLTLKINHLLSLSLLHLMIRRPPRSTHALSSAASDVYKRQVEEVLSIVDRQEGGCEALNHENVKLKSLFTIKDFL